MTYNWTKSPSYANLLIKCRQQKFEDLSSYLCDLSRALLCHWLIEKVFLLKCMKIYVGLNWRASTLAIVSTSVMQYTYLLCGRAFLCRSTFTSLKFFIYGISIFRLNIYNTSLFSYPFFAKKYSKRTMMVSTTAWKIFKRFILKFILILCEFLPQ